MKRDDFEFCAIEESKQPGIIAQAVATIIRASFNPVTGEEKSIDQAMAEIESVLDIKAPLYAQSKKLKAKSSAQPAEPDAGTKPTAPRQSDTVPPATSKRTITIKNRQQAAAPIKATPSGHRTRAEITREAGERLAKLFNPR